MKPGRVEALTGWAGDWGPPLGKCFNYTTPKQNCNLYSKHSKGTKLKILFSVFVSFFFGALLKLTFCVKVITSVLLRFQFFEETKPLFPAAITSHTKSSVGNVNRNKYRKVWQYWMDINKVQFPIRHTIFYFYYYLNLFIFKVRLAW